MKILFDTLRRMPHNTDVDAALTMSEGYLGDGREGKKGASCLVAIAETCNSLTPPENHPFMAACGLLGAALTLMFADDPAIIGPTVGQTARAAGQLIDP